MTKCLLCLASISLLVIFTFAQPSHASSAFNDLSTNREIIRANFNWVFLLNQKLLIFKRAGDLTVNQKTANNKKEPQHFPHNFPTRSECRGSSRRQAKPDYPMLDFRFWISDEPCHKSKIDQEVQLRRVIRHGTNNSSVADKSTGKREHWKAKF